MANDHVGSSSLVGAPSPQTAPSPAAAPRGTVDNDAKAAEVEQRREHQGGGGDDDAKPSPEVLARARAEAISRATSRVRAPDRPSPFGVSQFPPLPPPPERR